MRTDFSKEIRKSKRQLIYAIVGWIYGVVTLIVWAHHGFYFYFYLVLTVCFQAGVIMEIFILSTWRRIEATNVLVSAIDADWQARFDATFEVLIRHGTAQLFREIEDDGYDH